MNVSIRIIAIGLLQVNSNLYYQSSLLNKVAKYVYLATLRRESILGDWALLKHHKQVFIFAWLKYYPTDALLTL